MLKLKLKSRFSDLISNVSAYSYKEITRYFTKRLEEVLMSYSGLFIYNDWDLTYELITNKTKGAYSDQGTSIND